MNIMKYRPSLPLVLEYKDEFLTSLDRIFDSVFNDVFPETSKELVGIDFGKVSYPKVNVLDEETKIVLEAEIPGLSKEQVKVEIFNDVLTIKGEKKNELKDENKKYLYRELKHSSFSRSFPIGPKLNAEQVDAKFENGILRIEIPKKIPEPKPQPKSITIN